MDSTQSVRAARERALPPPLSEAELADAQSEGAINQRNGRLAGYMFLAGGIAGTPALALYEPPPSATGFLLTALALASGAICLLVPWERVSSRWLHLVAAVASLQIFTTCMLVGPVFCWYFVLVAVLSAYVFSSRLEVGIQVGFAAALMFTAAAFDGGAEVVLMLVAVPVLITATALVWALRVQLEQRQSGYRLLSRRDALTGVGNYRELHNALADEVARHAASQRRLALILVDLDDFKQVNDRHGHLEGDRVLREAAAVLAQTVRSGELVARHGGDEFSVVAPDTSDGEARDLAVRLEQAISRLTVDGLVLKASTGCAIYPDDGRDSDALIAAADSSLRREKHARQEVAVPSA